MSSNQFRVYSFIISRTLGWQKYAEAIPMQVFLHGIREADGSLFKDEYGQFVASGTGIKKEDTIREAIGFLRQGGYITVFPGKRGTVTPANVYMPMNEADLARLVLQEGVGVLPEHLTRYFKGEHVNYNQKPHRVVAVENGAISIREVNSYGDFKESGEIAVSICEIERIKLDDWMDFKKRERL